MKKYFVMVLMCIITILNVSSLSFEAAVGYHFHVGTTGRNYKQQGGIDSYPYYLADSFEGRALEPNLHAAMNDWYYPGGKYLNRLYDWETQYKDAAKLEVHYANYGNCRPSTGTYAYIDWLNTSNRVEGTDIRSGYQVHNAGNDFYYSKLWTCSKLYDFSETMETAVFAHEIGHAFGLRHEFGTSRDTVMSYANYSNFSTKVTKNDNDTLVHIYGAL